MIKSLALAVLSVAVAAANATPVAEAPIVVKSTKFSGSFEDAIVGRLTLKSAAGSSLERRQFGSFDGLVILCSELDCSSCFEIETSAGDPFGKCEFTVPNPFFSFGLTNPPEGSFYPFTIGINIAPAACPNNLFHLEEANVCFNINSSAGGNGWTFQPGDISIINIAHRGEP